MTEEEIKASVVAYVERHLTAKVYCAVNDCVVQTEDRFVEQSAILARSGVKPTEAAAILRALVKDGHLETRKGIIEPFYRTTWNPKAPGDPSPEALAMISLIYHGND